MALKLIQQPTRLLGWGQTVDDIKSYIHSKTIRWILDVKWDNSSQVWHYNLTYCITILVQGGTRLLMLDTSLTNKLELTPLLLPGDNKLSSGEVSQSSSDVKFTSKPLETALCSTTKMKAKLLWWWEKLRDKFRLFNLRYLTY